MATIFKEPCKASLIKVAMDVLPLPEAPATPTMTGTLLRGVIEADDSDGGEPVTVLLKEVDLGIARGDDAEPEGAFGGKDVAKDRVENVTLPPPPPFPSLLTDVGNAAGRLRKLAPPRGAVSSATTTNGRDEEAERLEYAAEARAEAAAPATKTDAVTKTPRELSFDILYIIVGGVMWLR